MSKLEIALQLYTVRDLSAKDFAGAIEAVAGIGYRAVELAGFGNLKSAQQVRKVLDDNGIRAVSSHASLEQLEKAPNKVMDDNQALGSRNIVVPYLPEDRREDAAGWRAVADSLARIGRAVQPRGFRLAYHNHSFEFHPFDGKNGIDILWENTDPDLVRSEMDTFWIRHAGEDPVAYIHKLGRRLLLLHLKDMAPGPDSRFAPVGTGLLDFPGILEAAAAYGVEWGIVEQDTTYETPSLDAAQTSLEYLRKLGVGETRLGET